MNKISFLLLSLFFVSCVTVREAGKVYEPQLSKSPDAAKDKTVTVQPTPPSLKSVVLTLDPSQSILKDNGFYLVTYKVSVAVENVTASGDIEMVFYDKNENIIYKNSIHADKNEMVLDLSFSDYILYDTIKYRVKIPGMDELAGEVLPLNEPAENSIKITSVYTEMKSNKLKTSLIIGGDLKVDGLKPEWIRFIPPNAEFYWRLPFTTPQEGNRLMIDATLGDSKHPNYIENGKYVLQINYGPYGLIQKEFDVVDLYGNKSGPNYGLFIPAEERADTEAIYMSPGDRKIVNKIKIVILSGNEVVGERFYPGDTLKIDKKELFETLIDRNGGRAKLQFNKEYNYRIYIFANTADGLEYMSSSADKKIVFWGLTRR